MSDLNTLYDMVLGAHADTEKWLVLADHLDETGDVDFAELIRMSVALKSEVPKPGRDEWLKTNKKAIDKLCRLRHKFFSEELPPTVFFRTGIGTIRVWQDKEFGFGSRHEYYRSRNYGERWWRIEDTPPRLSFCKAIECNSNEVPLESKKRVLIRIITKSSRAAIKNAKSVLRKDHKSQVEKDLQMECLLVHGGHKDNGGFMMGFCERCGISLG